MTLHKLSSLFIFTFIFLNYSIAQKTLDSSTRFSHLVEVNKQWNKYNDTNPKTQISFKTDAERIQFHLNEVIKNLKRNPSENLSLETKNNRNLLLESLQKYADEKVFPSNLYHSERTPYFVDDFGVHCAVGYMMQQSGNENLVQKIKTEHNYDYIKNIETDGLLAWANEYGFSIEELEWIQPSYGVTNKHQTLLGGTNGEVEKMTYQNYPDKILSFSGKFDTINESFCSQIAFYDGENLNCYENGLIGKINDIETYQDDLYVVGLLEHDGIIYSIANWNGTSWDYSNIPGLVDAEINSVSLHYPSIYGYYFSVSNPNNSGISEIWNQKDGNWTKMASVKGKVYDIKSSNDSEHYFVGHFDTVFIPNNFTGLEDTLYATNVLIKDYNNNWETTGNQVSDTIFSVESIGNSMYFGGHCAYGEICLSSYLNNDLQPLVINYNYDSTDNKIKDLHVKNNTLFLAGRFPVSSGMSSGSNLASYNLILNHMTPQSSLNSQINAINYFGDEQIVAGKFTYNFGGESKYIAKLETEENNPDPIFELYRKEIKVSPNPFQNEIIIEGEIIDYKYELYDIKGKLIYYGISKNNYIRNLNELSSGIYFLHLNNDKQYFKSKIIKL